MGVVSNKVDITDLQKGAGGGGGDLPERVTALEAETVQLAEGLALVQTSVQSLDLESLQLAEGLARVQTSVNSGAVPMQTGNKIKFGVDGDGNYGYYKAGADTVTPFLTGGGGLQHEVIPSPGVPPSSTRHIALTNKPNFFILFVSTNINVSSSANMQYAAIIVGELNKGTDTYTTIFAGAVRYQTSNTYNPVTNIINVSCAESETGYDMQLTGSTFTNIPIGQMDIYYY